MGPFSNANEYCEEVHLFALGVPIFFIAILLLYWCSSKKKKEQLNRIEEKLDSIQKKTE